MPNFEATTQELIVHLAPQLISLPALSRIIYQADLTHLERYGRTILTGHYAITSFGPMPSEVFEHLLLNTPEYGHAKGGAYRTEAKALHGLEIPNIIALRPADLDQFSDSELECLEANQHHGTRNTSSYWLEYRDAITDAAKANERTALSAMDLAHGIPNNQDLLEYLHNPHP